MKKLVLVLTMAVMFGVVSSNVYAYTPWDNTSEKNIHDAVNRLINPVTDYTANSQLDPRQVSPDSFWTDLSPVGFQGSYIAIGVAAGNKNTLYVYKASDYPPSVSDLLPTGLVDLTGNKYFGKGTVADPFTKIGISPLAAGTNFGWVLGSTKGTTTTYWNSAPGANTLDYMDHMLTYRLPELDGTTVNIIGGKTYKFYKPYLIAWEDVTWASSDHDFNDMMYLVDMVVPVPEPMTMLLLGGGLLGLVGLRRKFS